GRMMMLPGIRTYRPPFEPFVPGYDLDPASVPDAIATTVARMNDGDTLTLTAGFVRRTIGDKTFVMYAFNRQSPGPAIRVDRDTEVVIDFRNEIDLPTTVHWHGLRLDNRFDGVPGVTQDLVRPGESFVYRLRFPDAGIYWYHPHHREDVQQEMGLYGNMLVDSPDSAYFAPVNREEFLILDDLLLEGDHVSPFGLDGANFALMGRFGDVMLLNGEHDYALEVDRGEVVRFYVTNVANTRVFNFSFAGAPIKVVGGDIGKFEREVWTESIVISPAERYVIEVRFDDPGSHAITNRVQTIDHFMGEFASEVDTLGFVSVSESAVTPDHSAAFADLRTNSDVIEDIDRFREHFTRAPDFELDLTIRVSDLPAGMIQFMGIDTTYYPPAEWTNSMPMMNWVSNTANTHWILRDRATGAENMNIDWSARVGDVVKIRIWNDPKSFHPMSHPIHLHGQRFLLVERDGVPNPNMVWKETILVPVGTTVDVLVDITNPGAWMLHCHIAEHLESGMMMTFRVDN
ncbi:MAG: multicopper oxidase family protein, partial [Gemmatimonadales bacterium]